MLSSANDVNYQSITALYNHNSNNVLGGPKSNLPRFRSVELGATREQNCILSVTRYVVALSLLRIRRDSRLDFRAAAEKARAGKLCQLQH